MSHEPWQSESTLCEADGASIAQAVLLADTDDAIYADLDLRDFDLGEGD